MKSDNFQIWSFWNTECYFNELEKKKCSHLLIETNHFENLVEYRLHLKWRLGRSCVVPGPFTFIASDKVNYTKTKGT